MQQILLRLTLLLLICLLCQNVFSQEAVDLPNNPFGSAGDCKDRNLIINCFVSEPKKEWTQEEKEAILVQEQTGIEWLKKQATKRGIFNLSYQTFNLGLKNDITVDKIERASEPKKLKVHWATFALHAAGYSNVYRLYDTLKKRYNVDNVVVIVFARKEGRSYAQPTFPAAVAFNKEMLLEGAVVYRTYWDTGKDLCAGTIMHEMLHLYGAWDMYQSDLRGDDVQVTIDNLFKKSIMIHDRDNELKGLMVDQLTAWRIGWTKTYWPWYEMFRKDGEVKYWNTIPGAKQED